MPWLSQDHLALNEIKLEQKKSLQILPSNTSR